MPILDDLARAGVFLSADGTLHISTEKECATCHATKPLSEFRVNHSHGKRVHGIHCLQCFRQLVRARNAKHAAEKSCQESAADSRPTSERKPARQTKEQIRAYKREWDRKRKEKKANAIIEDGNGAISIVTDCPKPAAKLEQKTESKQRRRKTPDYDNAVLSQAKEFNIAWEALLNRPGLVIREEHKGDVIRQLKRLRALTKQLINRAEGEAR